MMRAPTLVPGLAALARRLRLGLASMALAGLAGCSLLNRDRKSVV